jgi:hypothetical protein
MRILCKNPEGKLMVTEASMAWLEGTKLVASGEGLQLSWEIGSPRKARRHLLQLYVIGRTTLASFSYSSVPLEELKQAFLQQVSSLQSLLQKVRSHAGPGKST